MLMCWTVPRGGQGPSDATSALQMPSLPSTTGSIQLTCCESVSFTLKLQCHLAHVNHMCACSKAQYILVEFAVQLRPADDLIGL